MPTVILDRIPLPNLKLYTTGSVLLVSCCIYFAIVSTNDPDWRTLNNSTLVTPFADQELIGSDSLLKAAVDGISNLGEAKERRSSILHDGADEPDSGCGRDSDDMPQKCGMVEGEDFVSRVMAQPTPEYVEEATSTGNITERTISGQFKDVMAFMCQEPFCIWVSNIFLSYFVLKIVRMQFV